MSAPASILVGIDFSDCSRSALLHALRIGRAWGAAVNAVHVVDAPDPLASGDPTLGGARREVLRQHRSEARRVGNDCHSRCTYRWSQDH